MAVYDLEEQEKIDALKAWWKQWGPTVMAAVAVFVVTYAGVNWWRSHQAGIAAEAATLYAELQKEKDAKKAQSQAKAIIDKYANTAYAARAALVAAKASFEAGDLAGAQFQLEWVVGNAKEKELQAVARLRLAAVLAEQKKFDEALRALEASSEESFRSAAATLKGDILVAQGKPSEARAAYRAALDKPDSAADRQALEMKLEMLGEAK